MSSAWECYGMLSMRMGLQAINQTRGEQESLGAPEQSHWVWAWSQVLVSKSSLALPLSSSLFLLVCLTQGGLFSSSSSFSSSKRERERERNPHGQRSASITSAVFSCPWVWRVQTGCGPAAAPHPSVWAPRKRTNKCTHFLCVCVCVCVLWLNVSIHECVWEMVKGGMWTLGRGWQAC